jgi:hypothetical protein
VSNAADLSKLSHAEKDALILTLMVRLEHLPSEPSRNVLPDAGVI